MQFNIHATKSVKLTDSVREKIKNEFEHIKHNASHVGISLSVENDNKNHAKITLNTQHTQLHATGMGATLFGAIHDGVKKIDKQIQKHQKAPNA